jgi:hypothetical protein
LVAKHTGYRGLSKSRFHQNTTDHMHQLLHAVASGLLTLYYVILVRIR